MLERKWGQDTASVLGCVPAGAKSLSLSPSLTPYCNLQCLHTVVYSPHSLDCIEMHMAELLPVLHIYSVPKSLQNLD